MGRIRSGPSHRPFGHRHHYLGDRLLPPPAALVIAEYAAVGQHSLYEEHPASAEDYLFYLDSADEEMTGLKPGTLEHALWQAKQEFHVRSGERDVVD